MKRSEDPFRGHREQKKCGVRKRQFLRENCGKPDISGREKNVMTDETTRKQTEWHLKITSYAMLRGLDFNP